MSNYLFDRSDPPSLAPLSVSDVSLKPLNLVLLGRDGLAEELCKEIRVRIHLNAGLSIVLEVGGT